MLEDTGRALLDMIYYDQIENSIANRINQWKSTWE